MRIRRTALLTTLLLAAAWVPAAACPVCFGETDSPMAAGINAGVLFLLAVVFTVLSLFTALIFTIWGRIRRHERRVESLRTVIRAGRNES